MYNDHLAARQVYRHAQARRSASAYYARRQRWSRLRRPARPLQSTATPHLDLYVSLLHEQQAYWDQHLRRQANQRKMAKWLDDARQDQRRRMLCRDLTTRVRATYVRHSSPAPFGDLPLWLH